MTQILLVQLAINRETVSCFRTSYTCENCGQNSFRMHQHIYLSCYTNIWWKKYSHVATPTLQPDLIPCNFFQFTKLKSVLKGMWFDDLEEIKPNRTRILKALISSDFKSCLKAWERQWNKCIKNFFLDGGLLWGYWGLVCVKLLNSIF